MIIILVSKIDISNLSEEELLQKQQVSHFKNKDDNIQKCEVHQIKWSDKQTIINTEKQRIKYSKLIRSLRNIYYIHY